MPLEIAPAEKDSRPPAEVCASDAADAINALWPCTPRVALILGTGMGHLTDQIEIEAAVPYAKIPGFRRCTALGHAGRLVCGRLAGVPVAALEGRFHAYEGCSHEEITLPVRALARLGAEVLIVSNASGGLNPKFAPGDVLVIEDHIDLMFRQSSRHTGCAVADGTRSVPATFYDPALVEQALAIARRENFAAHRGVYVALCGPNYETRAEYRFLRRIGADAVGMSTVPEVRSAAASGLRVLALSIVTNVARPDAPSKTEGAEVVAIAERAEPNVRKIVWGVVSEVRSQKSEVRTDL